MSTHLHQTLRAGHPTGGPFETLRLAHSATHRRLGEHPAKSPLRASAPRAKAAAIVDTDP